MTGFLLSPAARADLDEIWDYTARRWSVEQAERYIRALVEACQEIAVGSREGVAVEHIRRGYLKLAVGSHFVFYRQGVAGPEIIRVLHQRMDVEARLH